jgi:hypothetical protein
LKQGALVKVWSRRAADFTDRFQRIAEAVRALSVDEARLKGINSKTKRLADGSTKTYYWAWKGGPRVPGKPGSPEFVAAYNAAIAQKVAPPKGVLLALLFKFQASGEFEHKISERTKRDYVKQIKRIERAFSDFPINALDDPGARAVFLDWRDELAKTSLRQGLRLWHARPHPVVGVEARPDRRQSLRRGRQALQFDPCRKDLD